MPRDDFSQSTKETLARRVAYRCSQCGRQTSGPQTDPKKSISVGVAAHITAASDGGPRYNPSLTAEERAAAENGIWMCQNHGKLVDCDESRYTVEVLRSMKAQAEAAALRALEQPAAEGLTDWQLALRKVEKLMPELLEEMRTDLASSPLRRDFVILSKGWSYWNDGNTLEYYLETHSDLPQKIAVMENLGLVRDVTFKNVKRYRILEEFADYLQSTHN